MKRVLLLAGTAEARTIAAGLKAAGGFHTIASLAGATSRPAQIGDETRVGGFGGAAGLAEYVEARGIDLIVDATHPFAAQMKANAAAQAVPMLHIIRPEWRPEQTDLWQCVPDLDAAAAAIPADARAFLALGQRHLEHFQGVTAESLVVRSAELAPPISALGLDQRASGSEAARRSSGQARGRKLGGAWPFHFVQGAPNTAQEETDLFRALRITHLVSRNSGGGAGYGKIAAARALGLPVIMVDRPPPPDGEIVASAEAALRWLSKRGGPA